MARVGALIAGKLTNAPWKWASLLVLGVLAPSFVFLLSISGQSREGAYTRPQCPSPTPTWTLTPTPTATSTFTPTPTPTLTPTLTHTPTLTCPDIQESCLELVLTTNTNYLTCATGNPLMILIKPGDIQGMVDLKGKAVDSTGQALISGADRCACQWQGKVGADPLKPIDSTEDCGFFIGLPGNINSILLRLTVGQRTKDFLIKIQP